MKRIILGLISCALTACGGSLSGNGSNEPSVNTSLGEAQSLSESYGKSMQDFQSVAELTDVEGAMSSSDELVSALIDNCSVVDASSDSKLSIQIVDGSGTCPISYSQQVNYSQQSSNSYSGTMTLSYQLLDASLAENRELLSHNCSASFNVQSNGSETMNMSMSTNCTTVTRSYGTFKANIQISMSSSDGGSTAINTSGTIDNNGKVFSFSIQVDSNNPSQPLVLVNGQDATGSSFDSGWTQSLMVF